MEAAADLHWSNILASLTPLLIALASGVWVVYKYLQGKQKPHNGPTVLQGQPVVKAEWTWQDELQSVKAEKIAIQEDLNDASLREDAYREELIRQGVEPRDVLSQAGLLPLMDAKSSGVSRAQSREQAQGRSPRLPLGDEDA